MSRDGLSSTDKTAALDQVVRVIWFLSIPFPSGTIYTCTGDKSYTIGGNTYKADARLGSINQINESIDLNPHGCQITLSGIDATVVNRVMGDHIHWLLITVMFGFLDANNDLLDTPSYAPSLYLGDATIRLGQGADSIVITGETQIADMVNRKSGVIASSQDQQQRYSGDTFFDYIAVIQNKIVNWGGVSQTVGAYGGGTSGKQNTVTFPSGNGVYREF